MGKWEEVDRKFTPPCYSMKNAQGDPLMVAKLTWGFTAIELRNSKNGNIKFIEQIGDQR